MTVLAIIVVAWIFWPRPIEGFWQDISVPCLCDGCRFLYFADGRVYRFHEEHGAERWGTYTQVSPGVYRFVWDHKEWGEGRPHTIYVHGLFLRWSDPTTAPPPATAWRLLSTTKPKQLLTTVPIKTLDGQTITLNNAGSEQPRGSASQGQSAADK